MKINFIKDEIQMAVEYMKRSIALLEIREIKIKIEYHNEVLLLIYQNG